MTIYKPYTYLIGWSSLNVWYYGVRYAKTANPNDLWVSYFTSSKKVKEFRKIHGEPDIKEVRRTFSKAEDARHWEFTVLNRMNCVKDSRFLNESNAGLTFYTLGPVSEETRSKMRKPKSNETRIKMSEAKTGKRRNKHTDETRAKISEALTNRKHSEETKAKIKESWIRRKLAC